MIIIKRNEKDSIDRMLKKYRQRTKEAKQIKELRDRRQYTKPSESKRLQKQKAVYTQQLRNEEEKNR
jgi:small subunit ribosomal protein S21